MTKTIKRLMTLFVVYSVNSFLYCNSCKKVYEKKNQNKYEITLFLYNNIKFGDFVYMIKTEMFS